MKKILFVCACLMSLAFAKDKEDFNQRKAKAIEKSKDCFWICEGEKLVLMKGDRKAVLPSSASGKGGLLDLAESAGGKECPYPPKQKNCKNDKLNNSKK